MTVPNRYFNMTAMFVNLCMIKFSLNSSKESPGQETAYLLLARTRRAITITMPTKNGKTNVPNR